MSSRRFSLCLGAFRKTLCLGAFRKNNVQSCMRRGATVSHRQTEFQRTRARARSQHTPPGRHPPRSKTTTLGRKPPQPPTSNHTKTDKQSTWFIDRSKYATSCLMPLASTKARRLYPTPPLNAIADPPAERAIDTAACAIPLERQVVGHRTVRVLACSYMRAGTQARDASKRALLCNRQVANEPEQVGHVACVHKYAPRRAVICEARPTRVGWPQG
jgi:hypothetical protein